MNARAIARVADATRELIVWAEAKFSTVSVRDRNVIIIPPSNRVTKIIPNPTASLSEGAGYLLNVLLRIMPTKARNATSARSSSFMQGFLSRRDVVQTRLDGSTG